MELRINEKTVGRFFIETVHNETHENTYCLLQPYYHIVNFLLLSEALKHKHWASRTENELFLLP